MKYLPHNQADLEKVLNKKEGIVTCRVPVGWSNLGIPKTSIRDQNGVEQMLDNPIKNVTLLLDPENEDQAALMEFFRQAYDSGLEKLEREEGKDPEEDSREPFPIKKDKDKEGKPTGLKRWTIGRKVAGFSKKKNKEWTWKIPVVDAQGRPVPEEVAEKIGPGSVVRVAFQIRPWVYSNKYGVTADLDSVRLLSLEEKPSAGGVDWGGEDEGFSVEEAEASAFGAETEASATQGGDY